MAEAADRCHCEHTPSPKCRVTHSLPQILHGCLANSQASTTQHQKLGPVPAYLLRTPFCHVWNSPCRILCGDVFKATITRTTPKLYTPKKKASSGQFIIKTMAGVVMAVKGQAKPVKKHACLLEHFSLPLLGQKGVSAQRGESEACWPRRGQTDCSVSQTLANGRLALCQCHSYGKDTSSHS